MKKSFIFSLLFVSISMRAMEHSPKGCSSTTAQAPGEQSVIIALSRLTQKVERLADAQEEANKLALFGLHISPEVLSSEKAHAAIKAALLKYNLLQEESASSHLNG